MDRSSAGLRSEGGAAPAPDAGWTRRFALAGAGLTVAIALAYVAQAIRPPPPLPDYGRIAPFQLVDERGEPFTAAALQGHVSVVDFIFTRCTSSCPRLTRAMATLQGRAAEQASRVKFVSISVDPDNDTPAVLAAYAAHAGADPRRWSFVTGPADDVLRTVVGGFKVSAAKIARGAEPYDVVHGNWFVLVDGQGALRGYYPSETSSDLDAILRDAKRLERSRS